MAILNSDLLHVTVHHSTKFQANGWNAYRVKAVNVIRDGQADRQTDGWTDAMTDDNTDTVGADGGRG